MEEMFAPALWISILFWPAVLSAVVTAPLFF